MLVKGVHGGLDVRKARTTGPANPAAVHVGGTPQRLDGPVEVAVVGLTEDQTELVEPTRPVIAVVQVIRAFHHAMIPHTAAARRPRYCEPQTSVPIVPSVDAESLGIAVSVIRLHLWRRGCRDPVLRTAVPAEPDRVELVVVSSDGHTQVAKRL
jgi:hypothetical protein